MSTETKRRRFKMVKEQLAGRGIQDEAVLRAMAEVPRHRFVPARFAKLAYEDTPLPIPSRQTISQPYVVAWMLQGLHLEPTDRVLDVGAGSGYAAAVLSRIVAEVYTIERHKELAFTAAENLAALNYDNVSVRHGDGTLGWPEHAPYNAIVVAAGGPEIPESLLSQLAVNGRLVMPVGDHPRVQKLKYVQRVGNNEYVHKELGSVRFVPLVGAAGWEADEESEKENQKDGKQAD